ncbi:MetQ/NlpA family ABC transporter substrate-binding protein [Pseudomonas aeruginosa]|nr:MetQ/NlpA family ABC transporter substrate-binding protein [Pseudomonas aeruginosa]
MALINTNYALEAKLNPTKDALAIEGSDSPYVNILVARPDNKDSDAMRSWPRPCTAPRSSSSSRRSTKAQWYRRSEPSRVTAPGKSSVFDRLFVSGPAARLPAVPPTAVIRSFAGNVVKTFRHILNNLKNSLHNRPTFEDAPCKN